MSDIPLHSIRRNKARADYQPIADSDSPLSSGPPNMHSNVTLMASSSTAGRRNIFAGQPTRKDRYVDDPEEEAGLLGDESYNDEYNEGGRAGSPSQVR